MRPEALLSGQGGEVRPRLFPARLVGFLPAAPIQQTEAAQVQVQINGGVLHADRVLVPAIQNHGIKQQSRQRRQTELMLS